MTATNTSGASTYTPLALTSGPPTAGEHNAGQVLADPGNQCFWVCREAGDPGVWFSVGVGASNPTSAGLNPHDRVLLATAATLPVSTYTSGVVTGTANGALTVDSVTPAAGDRMLVKDEVDATRHGLYDVVQPGTASTPFILRRSADMDADAEVASAYVFVIKGTVNAASAWYTDPGPFAIGTDDIDWTQFSSSSTYIGQPPISVIGNRIIPVFGTTESTFAEGNDERFGLPTAPIDHASSHYPGTGSTGLGAGSDPIATSAFTQAPVYAPSANTTQLTRPSGFMSQSARTLTPTDKDVGYYTPFDLPADCPQIAGITHYIKTAASGGGAVTTPIAGTDSSTFEAGVGSWVAHTNATVSSSSDKAQAGSKSLKIVSTAGGNTKASLGGGAGALNNRLTCAAGDTIAIGIYGSAGATGRGGCKIDMAFYDSSFNFISPQLNGSGAGNITDTTSGWTQATMTFTAPALATSFRLIWELSAAGIVAGEAHYIDTVTITRTSAGGASGAVFRFALYASDDSGQRPTGTPLAVTGATDATIVGTRANPFSGGAWDPLGIPQRVFVERVYQYSVAPAPHPTILDCTILPYAPVTVVDDSANQVGVKQTSGVGGALTGVAASADATTDTIPYVSLGVGEVTGGPPPPPPSGGVQFGMSKGVGPTNTGGGNIATATTVLENFAKAANGGVNVHFSATRIYKSGLGNSASFPSQEEKDYHDLSNNGKTDRTLWLSIAVLGKNADGTYQTPWDEIGQGLHNSKIDAWGTKLKTESDRKGGRQIWITLQHEMDAHAQTGQTAADYAAAARVFYTRLKAVSANIMVYWLPTAYGFQTGVAPAYYPGDAYVDAIGVDGYNPGMVWNGSNLWREFKDVFKEYLTFCNAHPAVRYMMVGEFGCPNDTVTPNTTRRATWFTNALAEIKTNSSWTRLKALIYWDNHDNKYPKKPDGTGDTSRWLYPFADWTWENLTNSVVGTVITTTDTPTRAAIATFATDSIME